MSLARTWRAVAVALLVATLLGTAQSSRADDWYPGIPPNDGTVDDSWSSVASGGIGYSKLAKQWFRNPAGMTVARSTQSTAPRNGSNLIFDSLVRAQAYFVSPGGAPGNYGYLAPVTVRSVGFGMIPVEATLQLSQRRKDGYPLPLTVNLVGTEYREFQGGVYRATALVEEPVVVNDALNVSILKVKIDGLDLGLKPGCRTVTPAPVHLVGPGYTIDTPDNQRAWFASHDPKTYFNPFYGGYMAGTVTIPAFTGCRTTSGDDISALMTKSASGTDNPIEAQSGWLCENPDLVKNGAFWPLAPGMNSPKKAGCEGVKEFPYPTEPPS